MMNGADMARKPGVTANLKVLIRREAIERRVRALARKITQDFRGQRVHLVGVLRGACIFLADLAREIRLDTSFDFISVSSYGKNKDYSGEVRLIKDVNVRIQGLNVILVEDILDTGLTVNYLLGVLRQHRPRTLRIAALLDKSGRRIKRVKAHYVGFRIPNEFVVGYGLDFAERYRNLKDVCALNHGGNEIPMVVKGKYR
jgi:hypoxanthine phosphoribosyltransferase